jgi:hypothetical protein
LGLSRVSLYYQPQPPSTEEIAIKYRIDELYSISLISAIEHHLLGKKSQRSAKLKALRN